MPGRTFNGGDYRYGMNGQEKDDEIANGIYTAEYWEYDSRLGRRWNLDPVVRPWQSRYSAFGNNPIVFGDPNGADEKNQQQANKKDAKDGDTYVDKNGTSFSYNGSMGEWYGTEAGQMGNGSSSSNSPSSASTSASLPNITTRYTGPVTYNKTSKVDNSSGATKAMMAFGGLLAGDDATGVGVADDPLLIPLMGGLLASSIYDAYNARDKDDAITIPYTIAEDDPRNGRKITLYRGVSSSHLDFSNALKGIATPLGGSTGHNSPEAHNGGNTLSVFTSWSMSRAIASKHALMHGGTGIVLVKEFYIWETVPSPDHYEELEMLVPGVVTGATPTAPIKK